MTASILTMTALAVVLVTVSAARAVRLLAQPGTLDTSIAEDRATHRFAELLTRKRILIDAIRSTQLDFETAKISAADRDRTIARLEREAAGVLRELEAVAGTDTDRRAAAELVASAAATARLRTGRWGSGWSPAALARHGGQAPEAS